MIGSSSLKPRFLPSLLICLALLSLILTREVVAEGVDVHGEPDCVDARQQGLAQAEEICLDELRGAELAGDADLTQQSLFQLAMLARSRGDVDQAARWHEDIQRRAWFAGSWQAQYRLAREQGILAHAQRDSASALTFFRAALGLALEQRDQELIARSYNDLGTAYRHIHALPEALNVYRQSLAIKRELDDRQMGTTLSNIGDLLASLGELDQAEEFYREALQQHRADLSPQHVAHTLESMASLGLTRGMAGDAMELARQAVEQFRELDAVNDLMRAGALYADLLLANDQPAEASVMLAELESLAAESDVMLSGRWYRVGAAVLVDQGRMEEALAVLDQAQSHSDRFAIEDRLAILEARSELAGFMGQSEKALSIERRLRTESIAHARRLHDRELASSRVLLEVAEQQQRIDRLQADNALQRMAMSSQRARTMSVGLAGVLGIMLVASGALGLQRRRDRRQRERQARLEARLSRYRQAAHALRTSSSRLETILDASDQAVLCLGADDRITFASKAALVMLGLEHTPRERTLDELFEPGTASRLASTDQIVVAASRDGRPVELASQTLMLEEELQIVALSKPGQTLAMDQGLVPLINRHFDRIQAFGSLLQAAIRRGGLPADLDARWSGIDRELQHLSDQLQPLQDEHRSAFRHHLVELMTQSLEVWEKATGTSRVDLAEKSGIWRVTIDDGRLRTRAMDRYLQLARLPRNPRWREVLRTAYFVLAECPGELSETLDSLAEQVRSDANRLGMS